MDECEMIKIAKDGKLKNKKNNNNLQKCKDKNIKFNFLYDKYIIYLKILN